MINDNLFSGVLPDHLSSNLIILNLANNNFGGSIPAGIGSLKSLEIFSLRSNRLNGSIPKDIIHLQKLQILDLSLNNLSGNIPQELGNLDGLIRSSQQADGYVTGFGLAMVNKGVLTELQRIYKYSTSIDLSCNAFDGTIPEEISLLKILYSLNFGRIPRESHFDTLSLDGSAFGGNDLLCGFPMEKVCEEKGEVINLSNKVEKNDLLLFCASASLGFIIGFWGLFFVLLLKKQKWWFPYWRFIDSVAIGIIFCNQKI
ncbi:hypothetical protein MKW92_012533 [Papaver armeniacum]|nr:hypothetical protein MKW92_012533 [Papaver armeniacum]